MSRGEVGGGCGARAAAAGVGEEPAEDAPPLRLRRRLAPAAPPPPAASPPPPPAFAAAAGARLGSTAAAALASARAACSAAATEGFERKARSLFTCRVTAGRPPGTTEKERAALGGRGALCERVRRGGEVVEFSGAPQERCAART
jgi:hypothetical protein